MAKTTTRTSKAAPKAAAEKPAAKSAGTKASSAKPSGAKDKPAKAPAARTAAAKAPARSGAAAKKPAAKAASPAPKKSAARPGTASAAGKGAVAGVRKLARQTSDAISELASDILADRIVPTIEQIKSLAASALSQDERKGRSGKTARKSPAKK